MEVWSVICRYIARLDFLCVYIVRRYLRLVLIVRNIWRYIGIWIYWLVVCSLWLSLSFKLYIFVDGSLRLYWYISKI